MTATSDHVRSPDFSLPACVWVVPADLAAENGALFEAAELLAAAWRLPLISEGSPHRDPGGGIMIEGHRPRAVILPASANSSAAALSRRLGGHFQAGCRTIAVRGEEIHLERLLYRQRIQATLRLTDASAPLVLTIQSNHSAPAARKAADPMALLLERPNARVLRRFRIGSAELDLSEADVIVAGGRGVGRQADWALVETLAATLNAAVAGSRLAMDAGWIPRERMVGESGRAVAPKLYIAIGISGAPQHLAGLKNSQFVVAINKDKNAPIFQAATKGIVGDLHEIVPLLIEGLRARRRGQSEESAQ